MDTKNTIRTNDSEFASKLHTAELNKNLQLFSEIFASNKDFDDEVVKMHLEKHTEFDAFLPAHNTYYIITDTINQTYPFIGKGFKANLGLDPEKMKSEGTPYWMRQIHPDDVKIFLFTMSDMMNFTLNQVEHSKRKKLTYSWNFRVKTIWGTYKHIHAYTLPIILDNSGKPILGVTQHTVVGEGEPSPIIGTVKILTEDGYYETLHSKNYSLAYYRSSLSEREFEIAQYITQHYTSKQIADTLHLSVHTINTHRRNILKKTQLKSTKQLCMVFGNLS